MSISLPRTGRLAILASALVYTGASFAIATSASPLQAANGSYYTATLAASDAKSGVMGGVAWNCSGSTCTAGKGDARPLRMCRSIARKHGEVTSFKINGEDMAADELAKCNGQ
jgi:hypothetical protein